MQALIQLCRSHDCVRALEKRQWPIAREVGHLEIKLSLGKGKAFFEIGAMKRSLKWHLTAWHWLLAFEPPQPALEKALDEIEDRLDRAKHDPVLYKEDLEQRLGPVVEQMCEVEIRDEHQARAADILVRISHLLSVLRLRGDSGDAPWDLDTPALRCLKRAAKLDEHNLLVQTGLLRYEMRRPGSIPNARTPDPMSCWPSGATSVDQVIRAAEHLMLERLYAAGGPTETGRKGVARALMGHFMTHTDSINLRGAILHKYLMRPRAEDREPWWADEDSDDSGLTRLGAVGICAPYLEFVCLRRFGSFTPFMPRPAAVSAVGGGYLVRIARPSPQSRGGHPRMFNIVVDPGEGAVNNLYAMGLSIADIDMVIATHDHPEHLAALDAILSLRRELHERERARPGGPKGAGRGRGSDARLLILGNRSVVNRYSFLNGDGSHLVQHIADASLLASSRYPAGLTIDGLPTKHTDGGGHSACGFVLRLASEHPDGGTGQLAITFMSDTAIGGLHEDGDPRGPLDERWKRALAADVVVAHASDVPSGELRDLAELPPVDNEDPIADFDAGVRHLAAEHPADASQLIHALSLVPPDPAADPLPVSLMSRGATDGGQQLYLSGLLEVCEHMRRAPATPGREARILIVGELNEQLGSFRGTIAREINARMLDLPQRRHEEPPPPLIALTADIGLRIRLTPTTTTDGEVVGRSTVLCSTCSYNNDRLDSERFHPPQDIYDVCVKGDHEAMYWNCDVHDPGSRTQPTFVEQMGGYNPFAAGGRYHG
jgi:metallo-beta-lactamase superfamily protein